MQLFSLLMNPISIIAYSCTIAMIRSGFLLLFLVQVSFLQAIDGSKYPNMVVFSEDSAGSRIEVWYSGSGRLLERNLSKTYEAEEVLHPKSGSDSGLVIWDGISRPMQVYERYRLVMQTLETGKNYRHLLFRLSSSKGTNDLLGPPHSLIRHNMAYIQDAIDRSLKTDHTNTIQNPNEMYLFQPDRKFENIYGYLFMYSKQPLDSVMKFLTMSLVSACENIKSGGWVNDSTYRIDGLKQIAFGYPATFSLTIEHSQVKDGFTQYIIYVSNYREGDKENNYEIRLHDLHHRLWRFYNSYLIMASSR